MVGLAASRRSRDPRRPGRRLRGPWLGWGVFLLLLGSAAPPLPALAAGGGGSGGGGTAGGSGGAPTPAQSWSRSPEQKAATSYERAQRARDRALEYEEKARESDKRRFFGLGERPSAKAVDQWHEAVARYREAIESKPEFHEAYSDLGFAYRKLGDYERSLAAYDRALEIRTTYTPAIEYRGEAYLKLHRLEDAKTAYMRLFVLDRPLADQLLGRMQEWLAQVDAGESEDLSPEEVEAFREWVQRREQLASQAAGGVSDTRSW